MNRTVHKIFLVSLLTFQAIHPADAPELKKPSQFFVSRFRPSTYLPERYKKNSWTTNIIDSASIVAATLLVASGYANKDQIGGSLRSAGSAILGTFSRVSVSKIEVSSNTVKHIAPVAGTAVAGGAAGWFLRGAQPQPESKTQVVYLQDIETLGAIIDKLPLSSEELALEKQQLVTDFPGLRKKTVNFVGNLVGHLKDQVETITHLQEAQNEVAGQKNAAQAQLALVAEERECVRSELVHAKIKLHHLVEEKSVVILDLDRQRLRAEAARKGLIGLARRVADVVGKPSEIDLETDSEVISSQAQESMGLIASLLLASDHQARKGALAERVLDTTLLRGLPSKGKEQVLQARVAAYQKERDAIPASPRASEVVGRLSGVAIGRTASASGAPREMK